MMEIFSNLFNDLVSVLISIDWFTFFSSFREVFGIISESLKKYFNVEESGQDVTPSN